MQILKNLKNLLFNNFYSKAPFQGNYPPPFKIFNFFLKLLNAALNTFCFRGWLGN